MTQDEVLSILRSTGALLHGHFELRSKLHSPEYFQCANLLRYPREAGRPGRHRGAGAAGGSLYGE